MEKYTEETDKLSDIKTKVTHGCIQHNKGRHQK